jgi:hypothetical protein
MPSSKIAILSSSAVNLPTIAPLGGILPLPPIEGECVFEFGLHEAHKIKITQSRKEINFILLLIKNFK